MEEEKENLYLKIIFKKLKSSSLKGAKSVLAAN
jgi:hypothetical protein